MSEQDRYEPKERLATGLGGERWRALDTRTGTDVVLAVLDARTATAEERSRFTLSADASANLSHPGLEKVIDRGTTSLGNPYLVHEIVEAPSFAKRMASSPPWSIHEIVRVGTSLLDALAVAHSAGLVHGDIEPERVQVLPAGRARITCFGLSRASQRLTDDGWHTSFAFMSPEQANGEPPTAASDVYGVGALLYRAITGITPHAAEDGSSSRERIIDEPVAEVRTLRGEIPVALASAIEKAVANEPKQRFATAAELRKALTSALILSPTVARMHVRGGPTTASPAESARPGQRTPPPGRPASAAPAPKPASAAPKPASAAPKPASAAPKPAPKPLSAPAPKPAPPAVQAPAPVEPPREIPALAEPSVLASDETEFDGELIEELDEVEEVTSLPPDEPTDAAPADAATNTATNADADETETASTDTAPSTLARVQVKQVSVQRAAALTEEVASSVRRRDPRAERSNPPPPPARNEPEPPPPLPAMPAPAAPAPAPSAPAKPAPAPMPVAPAAIVSEPPPPPMISRAPMIALSLFAVGALVALLGVVQHCDDPAPVATPMAAPPHEIRQPVPVGTAPTEAPDAAIAEVVEDAATEAPDASLVMEVPPPVPTPPAPAPTTTASTMTSTTRPPSTMTTTTTSTPTVMATPPSEMTTPTVMTEPAMVTPMVDTTMRHIEVDPGF